MPRFPVLLLAAALAACATRGTPAPTPDPAPLPDVADERDAARVLAFEPNARERLVTRIDSILAAPEIRNSRWGVLVVHPDRGDTLYSRDAGKIFLPASNQKLVTGAVALRLLGPEYRFRTTFVATGRIANGELRGDLLVSGRGDPTFSARARTDALAPFREVADSLAARGIRRITGRVMVGDTVFTWPALGYGVAWENLRTRYGAPVADLLFDEGSSRVTVRAGTRVGAPVTTSVTPVIGYPRLRVTAVTLPVRDTARAPADTIGVRYHGEEALIAGGIPLGESVTVDVVHQDPRAAFIAALRTVLAERGIRVGEARVQRVRHDTLFAYHSAPLSELSSLLQKPSQNQTAEVLKRVLALEITGVGASDSGRRVMSDELLAMGAEPDGFVVGDGSGMSRYSFVSPETVVRLLHAMRGDTIFVQSLPLIGVEGTVASRLRGTAAEGAGRAKTGTISNAVALSGYLRLADGEPVLFSILSNNWSVRTREAERVIDAIVELLASTSYGALRADAR